MMTYDYVKIHTRDDKWLERMDQAGLVVFHLVSWLPWDGYHCIIMERVKDV